MKTKIESLLFISHKPLNIKTLISFLNKQGESVKKEDVEKVIEELKQKYNTEESGVHIIQAGEDVQMVTNPNVSDLIKKFIKDDMTGELTPASLETLTVIAYRGPIAKAELEEIRGVNCSLILRNLMIRGLIQVEEDKTKAQNYYQVTTDFLKHLGLISVSELPEYGKLSEVQNLEQYLENKTEENINQNN